MYYKSISVYHDRIKQKAELAIDDGRIRPLVSFEAGVPVNEQIVTSIFEKNKLTPEQDSAPWHCLDECLDFLSETFCDRAVIRHTGYAWPAHSRDLSP